jgi:hypothetical protein
MSFPPAAPWHRLQWYSLLPARLPSPPFFSLALLEVVTSQLLLTGILATNAPTNPVYMATQKQPARRAKSRLDSGRKTKKREVFPPQSPSISFRGRRRWRRQRFRSWRRSRRTQGLFSFSVGGGDGEQGGNSCSRWRSRLRRRISLQYPPCASFV